MKNKEKKKKLHELSREEFDKNYTSADDYTRSEVRKEWYAGDYMKVILECCYRLQDEHMLQSQELKAMINANIDMHLDDGDDV